MKHLFRRIYLPVLICCALSTTALAGDEQSVSIEVQHGDYLKKLCTTYLAEPGRCKEISRLNRLNNPDLILPGQQLVFPVRLLKTTPIAGTATFIKGDVQVQGKEGGLWKKLLLNDPINERSRVRTGADSSAEISYPDGTVILLNSATALGLPTTRQSPFHTIRELFLQTGRTVSRIKKATGKEQRFEIRTPTAVAAARGTEFRASVDGNEATRTEVLTGRVGVSAMSKVMEVEAGEGTIVRKGEPPAKPTRLLPPPEIPDILPTYRAMPLRFKLKEVGEAAAYRIALLLDKPGRDVIAEVVTPAGTEAKFPRIIDGDYFLQASSLDSAGLEGLRTDPVPVKVRINPLPPFIQYPPSGSNLLDRTVEFRWLTVSDASRYHLQIASDGEFRSLVEEKKDLREGYHKMTVPAYGTYYFRICSVANDGYEGEWSDTLHFISVPPPPAPPMDKPEVETNRIQIRWRDLGEGITYHFQMARNQAFNDPIVDEKTVKPLIAMDKPDQPGIYYARTSGIDTKGREGEFSAPQTLEIKRPFPYGIIGTAGTIGIVGLVLLLVL